MRTARALSLFRYVKLRAGLWSLGTIVWFGLVAAQGQSSVTVKVETSTGAVASDVKVFAKRVDSKGVVSDEVLNVRETGTGTGKYTIERLRKGSYLFFACDDGLKYAPDSNLISLDENESKRFTLVVGEKPGSLAARRGTKTKVVCLKHRVTGCEATKEIDKNENIPIRGYAEDYDQIGSGGCQGQKNGNDPRAEIRR